MNFSVLKFELEALSHFTAHNPHIARGQTSTEESVIAVSCVSLPSGVFMCFFLSSLAFLYAYTVLP